MKKLISIFIITIILTLIGCSNKNTIKSDNNMSQNTTLETSETNTTTIDNKPYIDHKKLVVFGDSITALGTWGENVAEELNMYFYNAAMGGITSTQGIDRFNVFVRNSNADFVTILFGHNDLIMNSYNTPKVSIEEFKSNLISLVNMTREIGATPILLTTNPLNPELFWTAQGQNKDNYKEVNEDPLYWLDEYNKATREVSISTNTDLVDMRNKFSDKYFRNALSDGIHLNGRGNEIFKNALLEYFLSKYSVDPNAEKVSKEDLNLYVDDNEQHSIISTNPNMWYTLESENIKGIENKDDNSISFYNTNGKWPDMQYTLPNPIVIDYQKAVLYYDIIIEKVDSSILIFFNGSTAAAYKNNEYIAINKFITDKYNSVGDINGPQTLSGSIKLSDLGLDKSIILDGKIMISGVKLFVAGSANQKVIINNLSVGIEE